MTKTEYRDYLASEHWQEFRRKFLLENDKCAKCRLPRWLASIVFDQDLNVHHLSYANLGQEEWEDVEPLCRRCHEIETFGRSELSAPGSSRCTSCNDVHFNRYSDYCPACERLADVEALDRKLFALPWFDYIAVDADDDPLVRRSMPLWGRMLWEIELILAHRAHIDGREHPFDDAMDKILS